MAKKIKFPLEMKNGVMVRTIEELQGNFDLNKIIGYFLDGKLLAWLEARSCYDEIRALQSLDKNDVDLHQKLCTIFQVEFESHEMNAADIENIEERNRRLAELKQYTSDSEILSKINQVAFNQEELADLIDEGVHDIYLCNNTFSIPLRVENHKYIGVGRSVAVIRSTTEVNFKQKGIELVNIELDDNYKQNVLSSPIKFFEDGENLCKAGKYEDAICVLEKSANLGNLDAVKLLIEIYADKNNSLSEQFPTRKALQWTERLAELDPRNGYLLLSRYYTDQCRFIKNAKPSYISRYGNDGIEVNSIKAEKCLQKSVEAGNDLANVLLGYLYLSDEYRRFIDTNQFNSVAMGAKCYNEVFQKATKNKDGNLLNILGVACHEHPPRNFDYDEDYSGKYFENAIEIGNENAMLNYAYIVFNSYDYDYSQDTFFKYGILFDKKKALNYLTRLANSGNVYSMLQLALIAVNCTYNFQDAYNWFKKAAENGNMYAKKALPWYVSEMNTGNRRTNGEDWPFGSYGFHY